MSGLGCLNGPGPDPTPVLSPVLAAYAEEAVPVCEVAACEAAMNAFIFEGKMLGTGAESGRIGGDAICCEARREVEGPATRGDCETGRGDGGTELRSGAMVIGGECNCSFYFKVELAPLVMS